MPGLLNIFPTDTLDQNHNKVHNVNPKVPVLKGTTIIIFICLFQKKKSLANNNITYSGRNDGK